MKSNVNYAILTTVDFSLSRFFLPLAHSLKKNGVNVHLIANMSKEFVNENSNDFACYSISMKRGFHLKQTFREISDLKRYFKEHNINVVEYATENISLPASIAAKKTKIPLRIYNHWGNLFVGYSGVKRIIVKKIEKTISSYSTHVRQVSEKNKELAVKNHIYKSNKAKVLGKGGTIGVDLSVFDINKKQDWNEDVRKQFNIDKNAFVLGYVGRIQKDKGINELIESFSNLQKKYPNLVLMLVGFMDESNVITSESNDIINNNKFIIVTGRVSNPERFMSSFNLLIHPTYREGFGMVLQEAGALDIPIITTNIIGPSEFISNGETGLLVAPKNVDELSNSIEFAINNYDKMINMSKNCYNYVINYFERKVMVEQMVEDRMSLINSTFGTKR